MTTLPGPTLGVVGGGQLGRMLAEAAAPLGVAVIVLDPTPEWPASLVAREQIVGEFDDERVVLLGLPDRVADFEEVVAAGHGRSSSRHRL